MIVGQKLPGNNVNQLEQIEWSGSSIFEVLGFKLEWEDFASKSISTHMYI